MTLTSLLLVNQIPALSDLLSLEPLGLIDWTLVVIALVVSTVLSAILARTLSHSL